MKTTIEISDALFEAAKRVAAERQTTLRALVEDGLRTVLGTTEDGGPFVMKDATVGGNGLREGLREGGWERILELSYEGHGG